MPDTVRPSFLVSGDGKQEDFAAASGKITGMIFVLAASDVAGPIVFAILGLLILLFPHLFILLQDVSTVWRGYTPVENHPMRSPRLYRVIGLIFILFGCFMWHL